MLLENTMVLIIFEKFILQLWLTIEDLSWTVYFKTKKSLEKTATLNFMKIDLLGKSYFKAICAPPYFSFKKIRIKMPIVSSYSLILRRFFLIGRKILEFFSYICIYFFFFTSIKNRSILLRRNSAKTLCSRLRILGWIPKFKTKDKNYFIGLLSLNARASL